MPQTEEIARAEDDGIRLDRWFRRHHPEVPHGLLEKWLRTGQVRVDGSRVKAGARLSAGQSIRVPPLPQASALPLPEARPKADAELIEQLQKAVLYRDPAILILNKPAGLAVQGGQGMGARHLDACLDGLRFEAETRPRLVHRLDKDTSGVLVLARTPASAAFLSAAFKGRAVRKCYWALVVGVPDPRMGRIRLPLSKQDGRGGEKVTVDHHNGKSATTWFRTVDSVQRKVAWLELEPRSGRTHQLRVHCHEGLHHPILGDGKYGGKEAFLEGSGLSRKLHLHARSLSFPHPDGSGPDGARMVTFSAPLPPHMEGSFSFFGFSEAEAGAPFVSFTA